MFRHITPARNRTSLFIATLLFLACAIRVPVPDGQLRALFYFVGETAVIVALAVFICAKVNLWVGLFLLLATFSCVYPVFGKASFLARQAVLVGCIWYSIVVLAIGRDGKYLIHVMCLLAIANTVFLLLQTLGIDPYSLFTCGLFKSESAHPTGLMANRNETAALLAMTLPGFFRPGWVWLVAIPLLGLCLAKTSGSAVAVALGVGFYAYMTWKRPWLVVVATACVLCFYFTCVDTAGVDFRLKLWARGVALTRKHWLFGVGIGHWKLITHQLHAHNDILQIVSEMGVFAAVVVCGYTINAWKRFKRKRSALLPVAALVIIIANALVSFPFYIMPTGLIAITWMAILEGELRHGKPICGRRQAFS